MRVLSFYKQARLFFICVVSMQLFACGNNVANNKVQETPIHGTIDISVDESFKPVIDSEIKVFESSFPEAKINVHYKSEADCFRDLAKDSTRMIIVTRGLNKQEEDFFNDSFHYVPVYGKLAYDAIAIIVNNKSKDTILTMNDVKSLLNGKTKNKQIVMDGVSATSTVRFVIDSILRGHALGKNVVAAKSSEAVINYVAANENASECKDRWDKSQKRP